MALFPLWSSAQSSASLATSPTVTQPSAAGKATDAIPLPKLAPLKVAFTLTAQGEATDIRLVASSGNAKFDQKCMAALSQARLQPRVVNGVPVTSEEIYLLNPTVKH